MGYSTGAALISAYLEREPSQAIEAVVFDSPNLDMASVIRAAASDMTVPGTPVPVPGSLTAVAMILAESRFAVDWGEINYVPRAGEFLSHPTLVFHGTADERVPVEVSREIAVSSDLVTLVEVAGAGHVASWNVDQPGYEMALAEFLGK